MKKADDCNLDPAEWDFRSCPDDLLVHCFLYEYARESPYLRRRFEKEIERGANYPVFFHFHYHDFAGLNIHAIEAPLGYPGVPFLMLEGYTPHLRYEKLVERGEAVNLFRLDKLDSQFCSLREGWQKNEDGQ